MPPERTVDTRPRTSSKPALDLPPPFRLVTLREVGDAFAHATTVAAEEGAGTLVYVGRFDLAEFAVVLEPEEPLKTARRALYAGLTALADALAVHAPPEKPITFDWPDAVRVDGGLVGGARLAWPQGADENEPPDWLVFGAMIRTVAMGDEEPGMRPLRPRSRRRASTISAPAAWWRASRAISWSRSTPGRKKASARWRRTIWRGLRPRAGVRRDIDDNGDLLVRRMGKTEAERRSLVRALAQPSWLDPATGGPRR